MVIVKNYFKRIKNGKSIVICHMNLANSLTTFGPHIHYPQNRHDNIPQCGIVYAGHHSKLGALRIGPSVTVAMGFGFR